MNTKPVLYFTLSAAIFLSACSHSNHNETATEHDSHDKHDHSAPSAAASLESGGPQLQADAKFQEQLGAVFATYIKLKDAFVASDVERIRSEATATVSVLKNVDMKLVTGAAHHDWMNYLSQIESSLTEIASSQDLDAQRKSFSTLSDNIYKSAKAFGLGEVQAFYAYCPMAFNNKGAYWLSDQSQIRNPYFGDKMLTCGEVKEKLN